ncbi:YdgA family protein [Candidatus Berkiella cookevillensis]|uniref:YdgA family protein n=1 Tax=Candidatus Berkiella cookevillensis TaxID=437022 RepID=A0A0Q9YKW8_9GAMM|nr:DUF945 family protein [Candidatus Berkiella cookevillensis]MCS5707741.1 YdgA family protein [Candidatus Berkiella cookevillensis]
MKRKLFLYGLLVAVLVVGIPYFTGQMVKYRFHTFAQALSHPEHGVVTVLDYKSGWRKSYAKTRITLTNGMLKAFLDELGEESSKAPENFAMNRPLKIVLEHEIEHGPFVQKAKGNWKDWLFVQALIQSKLHLSEEAKALLEQEIGEKDFISVTTEISMDNDIHLSLQSKPISVTENNAEHTIWQGVEGIWHFTDDLKTMTGKMTIPGFYLETAGKEYWVEDLLLTYDSKHLSEVNATGNPIIKEDNKLFINKITARSKNQHMLILHSVAAENKSDQKTYNQFSLKVALLELDAHEYGALQLNASLQNSHIQHFTAKGAFQGSSVLLAQLAQYYSSAVSADSTLESVANTENHDHKLNHSIAALIEEAFRNKIIVDQDNNATLPFEFVDGQSVLK